MRTLTPQSILFVGQQSLTSPSGVGRHWPMAKELARRGHRVRYVTLHHDWHFLDEREFIKEGVEVFYAGQMQVLKRDGEKRYFSPAAMLRVTSHAVWALQRAIASALAAGFSIVHLLKPQPVNSLAWQLCRARADVRLFVDCDDYETGYAQRSRLLRYPVSWFERTIPTQAEGVTYHTRAMRQRLLTWGVAANRLCELPNGVDSHRFAISSPTLETRLRQRIQPNGEPVILYFGSLSIASHAVDMLISAFVQVHSVCPKARLLIVGLGPDRMQLERMCVEYGINHAVTFEGEVPPEDIPSYLRIASVSVEATRRTDIAEGRFPLKLVESMAMGIPIVCGDVGERARILTAADGAMAGLIVEPDSADALAAGIVQVLSTPGLANALQQICIKRAPDFDWAQLIERVEALYQSSSLVESDQ